MLSIATLNIDWARKQKSKHHYLKIETLLNSFDFDILVLTESVALNLPSFKYVYRTDQLPADGMYEGFDYGEYLKKEPAYRVTIYSKFEAKQSFAVTDPRTSICKKFETAIGPATIYGTIVGTQFNRKPFAEIELNNCITDCQNISVQTDSLCLVGDLNTSFIDDEKDYEIKGINSRKNLEKLCLDCNLAQVTKPIRENIDHIFISNTIMNTKHAHADTFVAKEVLSDHAGIIVKLQ